MYSGSLRAALYSTTFIFYDVVNKWIECTAEITPFIMNLAGQKDPHHHRYFPRACFIPYIFLLNCPHQITSLSEDDSVEDFSPASSASQMSPFRSTEASFRLAGLRLTTNTAVNATSSAYVPFIAASLFICNYFLLSSFSARCSLCLSLLGRWRLRRYDDLFQGVKFLVTVEERASGDGSHCQTDTVMH